jgi:cation transporter-like permease
MTDDDEFDRNVRRLVTEDLERLDTRVRRRTIRRVAPLLVVLALVGVVAGAVLIGQQTFPTTITPTSPMTLNCPAVIQTGAATGSIRFACSATQAAFAIATGGAIATPTVSGTLPSGWTLSAVTTGTGGCTTGQTITTTPITFAAGSFDYCIVYTALGTASSLAVSWSQ